MERLTKRYELGVYKSESTITNKDVFEKLADYEDAEEQGLLLRLPCKVGDKVYWVYDKRMIREVIVYGFRITHNKILMFDYSQFSFGNMGVDVFLTREEAEQTLAEMETR